MPPARTQMHESLWRGGGGGGGGVDPGGSCKGRRGGGGGGGEGSVVKVRGDGSGVWVSMGTCWCHDS